MKALLIIGMQVDLLPGGPAEVPDSQALIPVVNQLMERFDLVVAANFWMQPTHVSFAANHLWRRPGQEIEINGSKVKLNHIFGVPGSFGAEFIPGLATHKVGFTAQMGTDENLPPYSAFFDAGKKRETGLSTFLSAKEVTDVYLAGMPLEDEVKNTALDSISLGYQTFLVKDACMGRSTEAVGQTLNELAEQSVIVLPTHHI